ncbi:MAG TPA: thioesterase family protein [Conexibacter sp.]|nr:thioesterase family protein [Conexibacter sp.]
MTEAVYLPEGRDRFAPTDLARGPWDPDAQHGGAPAALIARAIERTESVVQMDVVRITYELLRPVPLAPLELGARVLRDGKRVQLVEASLRAGGQEVVRATALRIRRAAVPAPPQAEEPPPHGGPAGGALLEPPAQRPVSFAWSAMEIRFAAGSFWEVGPAFAWFRLRHPLVAGEQPSPLQRLAAAGDFGNGIATAVSWATHVFINPDLTLYVQRLPDGEWVGLDAVTRLGGAGVGVSDALLYDERGRVGRAQQGLYVAERATSAGTP